MVLRCAAAAVFVLCSLLLPPAALAKPYTPTDDNTVVQQLPYRLDRTQRAQQAQLASGALPLPQALQTAQEAITRSRQLGDPRELGLAQAALSPWWGLPQPPPAVRLLRATIRQSQHQFDAALAELDVLVQPTSNAPLAVQAQAELTRANVLQVLGRLPAAQASCDALLLPRYRALGGGVALAAKVCLAELQSLQGQAVLAEQTLAQLAQLELASSSDANTRSWLSLVRAELAERRGDKTAAAALWLAATTNNPDIYTRAAYADWLLAQGQHRAVLTLIPASASAADALALRRTIALHHLQDPTQQAQTQAAVNDLQARFDAARERGENLHQREEARFLLDVKGNAAAALKLAQAQWKLQKEPADAVLLARAAAAAQQPQALAPLRQFVKQHGWVDARLAAVDTSLQP